MSTSLFRYAAMEVSPQWIAIGITLGMALGGWIKMFWFDKGRAEVRSEEFKQLQDATLKHFKDCDIRHEESAAMNQQVETIAGEVDRLRQGQVWVGDNIVQIAAKLGVTPTQRPS